MLRERLKGPLNQLGCKEIGNNGNRGLFLCKAASRKLLEVAVFEILRLV
jgi:hypothetical protein